MTPKRFVVTWFEVKTNPYAECEHCDWRLPHSTGTTAAKCKTHVMLTGHTVRRVRETIAEYYPDPEQPLVMGVDKPSGDQ